MKRQELDRRDLTEIVIGALVLAFPVAVTEEVRNLSTELSLARAIIISVFVQSTYRHRFSTSSQKQLVARVLSIYGPTLLVSAAVLLAIDKLALGSQTPVAIKRTIIVAFPASFAATVINSLAD